MIINQFLQTLIFLLKHQKQPPWLFSSTSNFMIYFSRTESCHAVALKYAFTFKIMVYQSHHLIQQAFLCSGKCTRFNSMSSMLTSLTKDYEDVILLISIIKCEVVPPGQFPFTNFLHCQFPFSNFLQWLPAGVNSFKAF